jgi:putative ABC transport system ATP-binding protein
LDFETGIMILKLLKEVNQRYRKTVIIITHNVSIGDMAGRVIKMRSGKIVDITVNPTPLDPECIQW